MGRSGLLYCFNDPIIYQLLEDPNYEVRADGTIWTRITRTGKLSVKNIWRQTGSARRGYCTMKYQGSMLQIHRIIYAKFNGQLEPDLVVMHDNDIGTDNRPENLKLGTQSVNCYHRFREGRGNYPVMGNARLNWESVRQLRMLKTEQNLTHEQLSREFGISKGHVSQIVNNEIWIEGKKYYEATKKAE